MPVDSSYLQVSDGLQDAALMHITNSRSIGATTIEVDTVSGIPAKFIAAYGTLQADGFIDPSTMRNFYGHLSGSNLEIDGFLPGSTDDGNTDGQVVVIKPNTFWANLIAEMAVEGEENIDNLLGGWIPAAESWTYVSYDNAAGGATSTNGVSTGLIYVAGDQTSKYSAGMRVKFTQTTLRQGIITAVSSYDAGNDRTTLTIFFGTDYTLINATIVSPYYSSLKAPQGFPLDPEKWTVEHYDGAGWDQQSSPTVNTWYNPGSHQLTIPVGVFIVSYDFAFRISKNSATQMAGQATLSTANNSESSYRNTVYAEFTGASGTMGGYQQAQKEIIVAPSSKQVMYLNIRSVTATATSIAVGGTLAPTMIRAKCAYL